MPVVASQRPEGRHATHGTSGGHQQPGERDECREDPEHAACYLSAMHKFRSIDAIEPHSFD
jgi:hypothetical protein